MATEVLMPALSPTMTEGKIARWLKTEGEPVRAGDVLAEIETDKATMEVEAIDEGVLARIVIPEGTEHVAVNTPIAVIAGNGEDTVTVKKAPPAPRARQELPPEARSPQPFDRLSERSPWPMTFHPARLYRSPPRGPAHRSPARSGCRATSRSRTAR